MILEVEVPGPEAYAVGMMTVLVTMHGDAANGEGDQERFCGAAETPVSEQVIY